MIDDLSRERRTALVFEVLWDTLPSELDLLSASIKAAFSDCLTKKIPLPQAVIFVINDLKIFNSLIITRKILLPFLKKRHVACIVEVAKSNSGVIKERGKLPKKFRAPGLVVSTPPPETYQAKIAKLAPAQIKGELDIVFGHCVVKTGGEVRHMPAVLSLRRLMKHNVFVAQLREDIQAVLGSSFHVVPLGLPGSGVEELAQEIVDDGDIRVHSTSVSPVEGQSYAVLLDLYFSETQVTDIVGRLRSKAANVAVFAIASFRSAKLHGSAFTSYVQLPLVMEEGRCRFCEQGVPAIEAENLHDIEQQIRDFDAFSFWNLISTDKAFYSAGHWASTTTKYHYYFRILTKPILELHSYALALRLRNLLRTKGVYPSWITRIVCLDEIESKMLATALAAAFMLKPEDVVAIPRHWFSSITGRQIDSKFVKWFESNHGRRKLTDTNVVIVDQAAHHFQTLSTLAAICGHFGGRVLAFTVFLDRTVAGLDIGEHLPQSHYVRLYSWPSGPKRLYECACREASQRQG